MPIRPATLSDIDGWADLRALLWDDVPYSQHIDEIHTMLAKPPGEFIAFLDLDDSANFRAFAEVTLRHDYVNGCETSPVAFLEGIFVRPEHQRSGIGANLLRSVQSWAQERGCSELASDANAENLISHAFHLAWGFDETERVVYFRKLI